MLIVFEGIDGSGKDTQIGMLLDFLGQHKVKHRLHKYPTQKANEAFEHLEGRKKVAAKELADIFAQDILAEKKLVEKEITEGYVVVCDRYLHSTVAYQGVEAGVGKLKGKVEAMGPLVADLVVLLDLGPMLGASRKKLQKKPDVHERNVEFLSAVRKNYLALAREEWLAYRFVVVDASPGKERVFSSIVTAVEPLIARRL